MSKGYLSLEATLAKTKMESISLNLGKMLNNQEIINNNLVRESLNLDKME
jgi:hypothetical protein